MTETAHRLRSELALLSSDERAELAHFLLVSLDEGQDDAAEAAWDAELARRVEEIQTGKVIGEPAAEVFDFLRRKHT